ncbi:MAG: CinA family nicotinamide mononucleotide deamidase-related protein [Bacteroidota bacterium]|jgi:nicotinamide-nucleotide amidase
MHRWKYFCNTMVSTAIKTEIITIGDELLLGQTIDTNSAWIGKKLGEHGFTINYKSTISDKESDILSAISLAQTRSEIVLITGGLGPTKDDITKHTLCKYFNCGYRTDELVIRHLEAIFAQRGKQLLETNLIQAELPAVCETLFNRAGTAPGMWFENEQGIVVSMPGVPNEVYTITEESLLPRLTQKYSLPKVLHKSLVTVMIAESLLSKRLEPYESNLPKGISLAYLPTFNTVKLRLTRTDASITESLFDTSFNNLLQELGSDVFCLNDQDPAQAISKYLLSKGITFSTAESCTGGYIANKLMQEPGISAIFPGSLVAYANEVKVRELGVKEEDLIANGAVSDSVASAMARGICEKFNVKLGISTTGIAGPSGGADEKPVGLVFIGVCYNGEIIVKKHRMIGNREQFTHRTANAAFALIKQILQVEVLP